MWSDNDIRELYVCYCLAKLRNLKVIEGTYKIWKERNPSLWPYITAYDLNQKRYVIERTVDEKRLDDFRILALEELQIKKVLVMMKIILRLPNVLY